MKTALTTAQRSKRYRDQKNKSFADGSAELATKRLRDRIRKQRVRSRQSVALKQEIALSQRKYRERKRLTEDGVPSNPTARFNLASPYNAAASAGKAVAKVKAAFPEDEDRKKYIWQRIGLENGWLRPEDISDEDRSGHMMNNEQRDSRDELVNRIQQFYLRRDVCYTTPG